MNALKLTASALSIAVAAGLASPAFAADVTEKPNAAKIQKSTGAQTPAADAAKAGADGQGSIDGVRASIEEAQAAIEADDLDKAEKAVADAKQKAEKSGVAASSASAQGGDAKAFSAEIDRAQKALSEDDAETASAALTAANEALGEASSDSGAGTNAGTMAKGQMDDKAQQGGAATGAAAGTMAKGAMDDKAHQGEKAAGGGSATTAKGAMDDKARQGEKAAGASDQATAPSLADKNSAAAGAGSASQTVQSGAAQNPPSDDGILVSDLLGKDVQNSSGESVGELEDVVYDNEKLTHFVISVGGFLGIGDKDVALPASDIQLTGGQVTLRGQMTEDMLKEMPAYEPNKFTPSERESRVPTSGY